MLFYKKNSGSPIEVRKEAPNVGTPYMVSEKNKFNGFHNDSSMMQVVGGYDKGPDNSLAKELSKRYPLSNE